MVYKNLLIVFLMIFLFSDNNILLGENLRVNGSRDIFCIKCHGCHQNN